MDLLDVQNFKEFQKSIKEAEQKEEEYEEKVILDIKENGIFMKK